MDRRTRKQMFERVDIYPVTYERLSAGRSNLEVLQAVIEGGARIVQLREKEYSKRDLYHLGLSFREITAKAGILLIVNDHVDIALGVDADGVHLDGFFDTNLIDQKWCILQFNGGINCNSYNSYL